MPTIPLHLWHKCPYPTTPNSNNADKLKHGPVIKYAERAPNSLFANSKNKAVPPPYKTFKVVSNHTFRVDSNNILRVNSGNALRVNRNYTLRVNSNNTPRIDSYSHHTLRNNNNNTVRI